MTAATFRWLLATLTVVIVVTGQATYWSPMLLSGALVVVLSWAALGLAWLSVRRRQRRGTTTGASHGR